MLHTLEWHRCLQKMPGDLPKCKMSFWIFDLSSQLGGDMQNWEAKLAKTWFLHGKTFELLFSAGFGSTWRCSKIQQNDGPAFVGWPDLSCQMEFNSQVGTNGKVTSLATSWSLPCLDASTMMYIHTTLSSYINTINTVLIVNPLRCSKGHDPFHHIPSPLRHFYDHMIIKEAMQKRYGCHLQVTVVNVKHTIWWRWSSHRNWMMDILHRF